MRDRQLILFENNLIKQLVLIGGGHANVQILKKLCMNRIKGVHTILISENYEATYSGMTPGYIHRDFSREEISIDLQRLCFNAGATFIKDKVIKLETNYKKVVLQKFPSEHLIFELLFFSQFKALAINLAVVVFPTPLIPVKRYAFGVLSSLIALVIVSDITS